MSRSLSGSLIILESAGKIYRGRVVVARREATERDRKEHEEEYECRSANRNYRQKINGFFFIIGIYRSSLNFLQN